ncbi:MAG: LysM peptidoglycan-binding domain-containing protein [Planctomycetia bacterium]|nr:LysM peptidoglycan-binding domain-containing protein [Planctomycetia bacterium]
MEKFVKLLPERIEIQYGSKVKMEMIRTIVVAMFFAGVTVGSYYFLSSSPFPWETAGKVASTGNTSGNVEGNTAGNMTAAGQLAAPTLNAPETPTFADAGPFAPAPTPNGNDDGFSLPALDELPPAPGVSAPDMPAQELPTEISGGVATAPQLENQAGTASGMQSGTLTGTSVGTPAGTQTGVPSDTPVVAAAPVLDTDLPSLNDVPPAVTASPEAPVGSELPAINGNGVSASVAVAPTLDAGPSLDGGPSLDTELPPGPELTAGPDLSAPQTAALPVPSELATDLPAVGTAGTTEVATDLPTDISTDLSVPADENHVNGGGNQTITNPLRSNHSSASVSRSANSLRTNAPTVAEVAETRNAETEAVREYLKIATEKIQNGNALEVLQSLSKYYGDPRFSAEELAELTNILVQAATLVIYSQQSFLEPAYTIQPGDTVEKIALQYQIPEEFIIRVNGLTAPFTLQPGTQLKVVKGPFHAIVYLDRYEMILTLNGLFAGRFWLGIGGDLVQKDGDFSFGQKMVSPTETYYEFLRVAGVPGCSDSLRILPATDPNSIGKQSLSGPILMSLADIDSLGALLGPRSQLIMRCSAPKAVNVPQNAVATNNSTPTQSVTSSPSGTSTQATTQVSAQAQPIQATPQVSMDLPAVNSTVNPTVNPAVGAQAPTLNAPVAPELPSEPATPYSLPGTEPAVAPELPQVIAPTDGSIPEAVELPTSL